MLTPTLHVEERQCDPLLYPGENVLVSGKPSHISSTSGCVCVAGNPYRYEEIVLWHRGILPRYRVKPILVHLQGLTTKVPTPASPKHNFFIQNQMISPALETPIILLERAEGENTPLA